MGWFKKKEIREETGQGTEQTVNSEVIDDPILSALVGKDELDRSTVMNIPAVSACVNQISNTVASLPIKLYSRKGDKIEEVQGDNRVALLNENTGDTLDGSQFKKAMVRDMYLEKGGYAYINRVGTVVQSIHYVEATKVSFLRNTDPIFKDYKIIVYGRSYEGWQFVKLLRDTVNGYEGRSVIEECKTLFNTVYSSQLYEKGLVKTGGNKKGFVKSTRKLTTEAMTALKNAFRKLYTNNTENVVILNEGLDFKESSNTSVEMQLNENKKTNNEDICKVFLIPPSIINGGATREDKKQYHEGCILPVLERFETALNSTLLFEEEKGKLFFAFDTTDLLKADIKERFEAYEIAVKNGFLQIDDVRKKEKYPALGLNFIKLGLQDVLYNPATGEIYTPNTDKSSSLNGDKPNKEKEGEKNESGDS